MESTSPPTTQTTPQIGLVGHCGFDGSAIRRAAQDAMPEAEVVFVNRCEQLDALPQGSLLLVNRVLDGSFESPQGVALIRQVSATGRYPAMLVSNFADAQQEAQAAGALPGFGKHDLGTPRVSELIRSAAATRA